MKPTAHILVEVAPATDVVAAPAKAAEVKTSAKKVETKAAPKAEAKAPAKSFAKK